MAGWGLQLQRDFGDYLKARSLASHGGDLELLTMRSSPDVQMLAKAAVAAVTTTTTPLFDRVAGPFLESLGQSSILDRIIAEGSATTMSYTPVSVNVALTSIAGGGVAEGVAKAVRSVSFAAAVVSRLKAVSLVVASEEYLRSPAAAEALVTELRKALAQAMNATFLADLAANADTIAASGSTAAAILTDLTAAVAALGPHERSKFYAAVDPTTYAEVGLKPSSATVGPIAFPDFPTIGPVTFMVSESLATQAIVFDSSRLGVADGGLQVDSTRHANIEMSDTPGGTAATSLWQSNLRGIRAERFFSLAYATPDSSGAGSPAILITGAW